MKKRLIAITGIDGCGKTTLIKGLGPLLSDLTIVSIWDTLKNQQSQVAKFFSNKETIDLYLLELDPTSRALFLLHPLYHALENALKLKENLIIIDSYWYKYVAGQVVYGLTNENAMHLSSLFPPCEHTFFLKVNPSKIVHRKNDISAHEAGYDTKSSSEGYIHFQNQLQAQIEKFLTNHSHTILNGEDSIQANIKIIMDYLK